LAFEVKVDAQELERFVTQFPTAAFECVRDSFRKTLTHFHAQHVQRRMTGRPGLNRRTGALAESFSVEDSGDSMENLSVRYVSSSPYVGIQESGGTITPTRGRYLAIPVSGGAALTASGMKRAFTPLRSSLGARSTFVKRSKAGNLMIFERTAGRGIRPLYVLKESVTIPGRLGTELEWEAYSQTAGEDVSADLQACMDKLDKETGRG
jgi:hypothetical protein